MVLYQTTVRTAHSASSSALKGLNRPGLQRFLEDMSRLYEMHVYTMGTRSYADAVCKFIDPEDKIFSRRILTRDESGSK